MMGFIPVHIMKMTSPGYSPPPVAPPTTTLTLTGGRNGTRRGTKVVGHALVLDDAFTRDVLSKHSWTLVNGYPATTLFQGDGKRRKIAKLHKLVYKHYHGSLPANHEVDHADRNPCNALPDNLRPVTRSINTANSGPRRNNKLGIKGITECQSSNGLHRYYNVRVVKDRKKVLCRNFPHTKQGLEDAIAAHKAAYALHYPEISYPEPSEPPVTE